MRHSFALDEGLPPRQVLSRLTVLAERQSHFLLLDSHQKPERYQWLAGWGARAEIAASQNSLAALYAFWQKHRDWCLGHLSFGLKAETEGIASARPDVFEWPLLSFFVPETLVYCKDGRVFCESYRYAKSAALMADLPASAPEKPNHFPRFSPKLSRADYLQKIDLLKAELQYGNIYEINFCQEWQAKGPLSLAASFHSLNARHQAPSSALYRWQERSLLCFSPERYLQKTGSTLLSQPIKGTAARGANAAEDAAQIAALSASEKERAENVMIVDLVRNDLSRTALPGSVVVPELFGIYSFNAVHQMISSVTSQLNPHYTWADVLATSFPMGSMTGAPKHSALRLIEEHENFNRGLYSGSVGYLTAEGDFDFNVVIRSILHHSKKQLSSVRVGSAITIHCSAEQEYEECLLKAEKLLS